MALEDTLYCHKGDTDGEKGVKNFGMFQFWGNVLLLIYIYIGRCREECIHMYSFLCGGKFTYTHQQTRGDI